MSNQSDTPLTTSLGFATESCPVAIYDAAEEVSLCSIELADLEAVCQLESVCHTNPWSRSLIEAELTKNISFRLGIKQNGELLAYSFNHLILDELHILNLAVSPEVRRLGLGSMLLGNILNIAIERRVRFATLEVRESNFGARRLYSHFGFSCTRVRPGYYRDNRENALILERSFTSQDAENFHKTNQLRYIPPIASV